MTRHHNQQIHCPNCKTWITHETSFGRWIRNNGKLDSGLGYSVIDQDYWIHKFKHHNGRDFQCIMLVEIKTLGMNLTDNQRDTLHMVNQIMRNRRQVKQGFQAGKGIVHVKSLISNKHTLLRAYGMHVLRFSGLGPDDSEWMEWDGKDRISIETLEGLLRFDLDPDTLKPLDLRLHHLKTEIVLTEKAPLGFLADKTLIQRS